MISRLQQIDPVFAHQVDDPVFLGQPARPGTGGQVLERLRLAEAFERITKDGLDQIQSAEGSLAIGGNPMPEISRNSG